MEVKRGIRRCIRMPMATLYQGDTGSLLRRFREEAEPAFDPLKEYRARMQS